MLKKSKVFVTGLLAVAALAAASSAMAYEQFSSSKMYGSGAMVEFQGRVYQHDSGSSRGDIPYAGSAWRVGNTWDDKGITGTQAPVKPPVSPSDAWSSGSAYAQGAVVSYNGVRYKALMAISASEFFSRMAPSSSSTRWARV